LPTLIWLKQVILAEEVAFGFRILNHLLRFKNQQTNPAQQFRSFFTPPGLLLEQGRRTGTMLGRRAKLKREDTCDLNERALCPCFFFFGKNIWAIRHYPCISYFQKYFCRANRITSKSVKPLKQYFAVLATNLVILGGSSLKCIGP